MTFPVSADCASRTVAALPAALTPVLLLTAADRSSRRCALACGRTDDTRKPSELLLLATLSMAETGLVPPPFVDEARTLRPLVLLCSSTRLNTARNRRFVPLGKMKAPLPELPSMNVFETTRLLDAAGRKLMPLAARLRITQFSTVSELPELNRIPLLPIPAPSMSRPRRLTSSPGPALMVIPSPPLAGDMPEQPWPWM